MNLKELLAQINTKRSYLCVGLDTDPTKIPQHLHTKPNAMLHFNKAIIDATKDYCVSYKINTAFYEALGAPGWEIMEETVNYIPKTHFTIADAKRGDIGNTAAQYARAFFEKLNFDAITVAPYMGEDSIRPFLDYPNKFTIVLGLTSNKGAADFELQQLSEKSNGMYLYQKVIEKVSQWGTPENLMFVTGATQAAALAGIRQIVPQHFLLVPGVGIQGGSLLEVSQHGLNEQCGLLVNVSRAIIYAGEKEDYTTEATAIAQQYQHEMATYLKPILG
jgi:orotidine-5'-phosphate decarboxylase